MKRLVHYGLSFFVFFVLNSCVTKKTPQGTTTVVPETPATPVTPAASCDSPKTKIIDRGVKVGNIYSQRGLWSDTKVIPGSQWAATVYYDGSTAITGPPTHTGGTASIKITYWDGHKYNIENVAADLSVGAGASASWLRLAFLTVGANAGRPIIAWATGSTNIKAAMRSAPLGTTGTWTTAILDVGAGIATRALALSVSPNDDVGIAYLTSAVAITGRVRHLSCPACTSLSGFTLMSAGEEVDDVDTIAAYGGISTGWCSTGSTYIPTVAYPIATALKYSYCNALSCATAADWTKVNIPTATATTHVEMHIDNNPIAPSTTRYVNILAKHTATGLKAYQSDIHCNTVTNPFNVGNVVSATTTIGNAWPSLMQDASGMFHIVANDSTTSMVYINSISNNFLTTTWNLPGIIETVTLPAISVGGGGADISSNGMIFSSYGLNATTFNLNIGIVNDSTVPSNSAMYYTSIPDTSGAINVPIAGGTQIIPVAGGMQSRNVSAGALSNGIPGVAYIDHSAGTLTGGRLKYALRTGTTASSLWITYIIPNTISPLFPSLAYDANDLPWISYYDMGSFRYFLATNSSSDGSGTWSIYQIPLGAKTANATAPAIDGTTLAMHYSGGVAYPVIIFINGTNTPVGAGGIKSIRLNPTTGQFGNVVTIDALGASYATRITSDFDRNGNIAVAYYDLTLATNGVKFNYSTNGGANWRASSSQLTTTAGMGREGLSLKFNPATSKPAISYYDKAANKVYYHACTTALTSCHSTGYWNQTVVQEGNSAVAVSGIAATTNELVLNTSLTFSDAGVPYIAYMTGNALAAGLNPGLALTDGTSGFYPVAPLMLATSATTAGASALSFGQNGMNVSSVRNSLGQFIALHVGPNNWLYSTSCGD